MKQATALTICSRNYLAKAATLVDSYRRHHPADDFYIVIVDRKCTPSPAVSGATIIWAEDLAIPGFECAAFQYDVIELNTNVKPTAMAQLLQRYSRVIYLDPDVYVYAPLTPVADALDSADVVVTPHTLSPIDDDRKPDEVDLLRFGTFNLGFIGVAQSAEGFRFLDWWSERCLGNGFYEPQSGLAVDQKWINLAPAFFPGLRILRDPGLNVAFWNLHERRLTPTAGQWFVNDVAPLYFVHFSSFDIRTPGLVAHKQTRYAPGSRPDFETLAQPYRQALARNLNQFPEEVPYGYDYFDSGTFVTPALRRIYASIKEVAFANVSPFDSASGVESFARRHGLLERQGRRRSRASFQDLQRFGWQQRWILRALKLLLRVIGPQRYFALMRYLVHISSLRNQGNAFLDRKIMMDTTEARTK